MKEELSALGTLVEEGSGRTREEPFTAVTMRSVKSNFRLMRASTLHFSEGSPLRLHRQGTSFEHVRDGSDFMDS